MLHSITWKRQSIVGAIHQPHHFPGNGMAPNQSNVVPFYRSSPIRVLINFSAYCFRRRFERRNPMQNTNHKHNSRKYSPFTRLVWIWYRVRNPNTVESWSLIDFPYRHIWDLAAADSTNYKPIHFVLPEISVTQLQAQSSHSQDML